MLFNKNKRLNIIKALIVSLSLSPTVYASKLLPYEDLESQNTQHRNFKAYPSSPLRQTASYILPRAAALTTAFAASYFLTPEAAFVTRMGVNTMLMLGADTMTQFKETMSNLRLDRIVELTGSLPGKLTSTQGSLVNQDSLASAYDHMSFKSYLVQHDPEAASILGEDTFYCLKHSITSAFGTFNCWALKEIIDPTSLYAVTAMSALQTYALPALAGAACGILGYYGIKKCWNYFYSKKS